MNKLKVVSRSLFIGLIVSTLILYVYFGIKNDFVKSSSILLFILILCIPKIIKRIFKIKIRYSIQIIYYLYVAITSLLGSFLHFYRKVPNYDTFAHFISGFALAYFGLLILVEFKKYDDKSKIFNILFFVSFSLMITPIWETIEFLGDRIFKMDMQRVATGVLDTMKDIIVHLIGTILFIFWYLFWIIKDKKVLEKIKMGVIEK